MALSPFAEKVVFVGIAALMIVGTVLVLVPYNNAPAGPCAAEAKNCQSECTGNKDALIQFNAPTTSTTNICLNGCPDANNCMPHNDLGFQTLLNSLQQDGFSVSFKVIRKAELPASNGSTQAIELVLVIYDVYKNDILIGEAYLAHSSLKTAIFAGIQVENQTILYVYDQDHCEKIVLDVNDSPLSIQGYSCEGLCSAICSRGIGAYIGTCTSFCIGTGAGVLFCDALCGILIIVGCVIGCDKICDLI